MISDSERRVVEEANAELRRVLQRMKRDIDRQAEIQAAPKVDRFADRPFTNGAFMTELLPTVARTFDTWERYLSG